MEKLTKDQRHQLLIEIIEDQKVETQFDLVSIVKDKGIKVTQTTISRDIDELGIVKGPKGYHMPDSLEFKQSWIRNLELHGLSILPVGDHMLVLKTSVSAANIIANDLDEEAWEDIVGTIAGSDTVFIAVHNKQAQTNVYQKIDTILKSR